MKRGRPYEEGCLFALPLENKQWALGVVGRREGRRRRGPSIMIGFFFGPARDEIPSVEEVPEVTADMSIMAIRCVDVNLLDGTWPIIKTIVPFHRHDWPMPIFVWRPGGTGAPRLHTYLDDNITYSGHRDIGPCVGDPDRYRDDSLCGAGFVEIKLSRLLSAVEPDTNEE